MRLAAMAFDSAAAAHGAGLAVGDRDRTRLDRQRAAGQRHIVMIALEPFGLHADKRRHGVQFVVIIGDHVRHAHPAKLADGVAVHVIDIDGHEGKIGGGVAERKL